MEGHLTKVPNVDKKKKKIERTKPNCGLSLNGWLSVGFDM